MKFNLKDQTYKGYTLTFKVNSSSFSDVSQIQLKFEKNGKALCYTKSFSKGTDMQEVYDALMNEVKTVVDYIEYQVECAIDTVKRTLQSVKLDFDLYHDKDTQKDDTSDLKTESVPKKKTGLDGWFDSVDTSRYLKDLGNNNDVERKYSI